MIIFCIIKQIYKVFTMSIGSYYKIPNEVLNFITSINSTIFTSFIKVIYLVKNNLKKGVNFSTRNISDEKQFIDFLILKLKEEVEEFSKDRNEEELADILIYLVRISDKLGIDLYEAAERKLAINERKYPADKVRGSAKKYTEYEDTK